MLQKGRTKVEWARWRHILYGFNTGPYNSDLTPLGHCASFATAYRPLKKSWKDLTMLSQVLTADMGFMQGVHGAIFRDKVRSCEIRKAINVETLLQIERSSLRCFGHVFRISQERSARQVHPFCYTCWAWASEGGKVGFAPWFLKFAIWLLNF